MNVGRESGVNNPPARCCLENPVRSMRVSARWRSSA